MSRPECYIAGVSLRYGLLGLLAQEPGTGYDLIKRFDSSLAFVWPASQSQVYGELARLSDAKLINVTATGARNRKEYGITREGRAELHRWLTESVPELLIRQEALLRVFFLGTVSKAEAIAYLEKFAKQAKQLRDQFEQDRDTTHWDDSEADHFERIVLEYGLHTLGAVEDWARWAADNVARGPLPRRATTRAGSGEAG